MPPLPALKHPAMKRLEEGVKGRPRVAILACIERAETLALEADPGLTYPEDWVAFRLLGESGAVSGAPALMTGEQLKAELGALAERLCAAVRLNIEEAGAGALAPEDLCARWNISRATLNRWRKRGLVARRVQTDRVRATLVFRVELVQRFESVFARELEHAGEFSRMSDVEAAALLARAEQLRVEENLTLNQAAAVLARETGRSHEGVRQVLRRAVSHGGTSFREAPPLAEGRRAVLYRAWRRGVEQGLMARKTRRSRGAVRRAINMERAERLREVLAGGALVVPEGPAPAGKKAASDPLAALPARTGLASPSPREVVAFIAQARKQGPPIGAEEKARLAAYQHLRRQAARAIEKLDRLQPSASAVDRAETMLRWASRLKVELVRSQARLMLDTLASRLGKPVEELPPAVVVRIIEGGLRVIGDVVDAHDVSKGARLAAGAGLALDRYGAGLAREIAPVNQPRRATAVIPADLRIGDWERAVNPWQRVLEPDARLREAVSAKRVPAEAGVVLSKRYGWDGGPPRTLAELAGELKLTRIRVMAVEQKAVAQALKAVRG